MNFKSTFGLAIFAASLLTAVGCGGGGGGTSATPPVSTPTGSGGTTPTPTSTPTSAAGTTVAGTVLQIPSDAYGPATIAGVTYQSADITSTTALSGATVIAGPVPIVGATAPATLPSGDVSTTTSATGAFSVTVPVAAAAPSSSEPFVIPVNNITGFTAPATGYYIEVFGVGADGKSASAPIPLHRFVAASTSLALHVSTTSSAEAAALVAVNSDRAANGAGAIMFDESAEEVARLHASDEVAADYYCHYDTHNVGPSSRWLQIGGIGLTGEALAAPGSTVTTATNAFQVAEAAFMAEKTTTPQGGHFLNVVDVAHVWAGLAATAFPNNDPQFPGGFFAVDYDLITPSAQDAQVGASGYPTTGVCPAGTINNNS